MHSSETGKNVVLKIRRQDGPDHTPHWEEFAVPYRTNMNIISCLQYIAGHPQTTAGQNTSPVVFDAGCLEEVCGACTMVINGRVRQACSTLVEKLGAPESPITLEPMGKYPLVRDLFVNRQRIFDNLRNTRCWVPIDGTYDLGPGPAIPLKAQEKRYPLSRCISCGCCMEACPQYTPDNTFVGAAIISQVRLFNEHPTGAALKSERLDALMGEGGISECGKAGNCVEVCPKQIPLLESIATVQRQATVKAVKDFFGGV
ncbi:MAG: succinate dehydrogenase iron-sulfur subunit [Tepidisphaerales bacterium]